MAYAAIKSNESWKFQIKLAVAVIINWITLMHIHLFSQLQSIHLVILLQHNLSGKLLYLTELFNCVLCNAFKNDNFDVSFMKS